MNIFIGENNFFEGEVVEILENNFAKIKVQDLGEWIIEQDKPVKIGDYIKLSIRPEKIKLTKTKPKDVKETINSIPVYVNELIYSGFQSKYFVHLYGKKEYSFKVFKQHAVYFDDNDEEAIWWDEDAYISWDADDGFLIEVI